MSRSVLSSGIRLAIALVLALALWVFVSFTENPQQSKPFTNIPLIAEGLDPTLTLVDPAGLPIAAPEEKVNLIAVGPLDEINGLTNQNVQPYVNLTGIEAGSHEIPLLVRQIPAVAQSNIEFRGIQPRTVTIAVEQIITTSVPLTVTTLGQPPFSYEASSPQALFNDAPLEQVRVRGPASQVRQVIGGEVQIDLSSQANDIRASRRVVPVDINGRDVEGVQVLPETVQIAVSIQSSSGIKLVPIIATVRGQPAIGLRPDIVLNPEFITLVGSSRALASVEFIETEPIDLQGATSGFSTTLRLRLPSGTTTRDGESITTARVELVPLQVIFDIQLPIVVQNVEPNLRVQTEPQLIVATLRGSTQSLQDIKLEAVVDVAGLGPGTYTLQPSVNLPGEFTLAQPLSAIQVIIQAVPTPTPQPTAAPTDASPPATPAAPGTSNPLPGIPSATPP